MRIVQYCFAQPLHETKSHVSVQNGEQYCRMM